LNEQVNESAVQALDPVAFYLGSYPVHWYGLIIGLGALLGLLWAIREGKKHGFHPDTFTDLLLYGVPAAIIGARAYYVIFRWDYYRENPGDIIAIWEGGLAIHGALLASVLVVIWFSRKRHIPFWKLMDMVAPGLIIGQAVGRWGNFMNQEAHGGVVSREFLEGLHLPQWIINQMYIYNPNPGGGLDPGFYYHHPTFLYESVWNLVGLLVLIGLRHLPIRQGELFLSYLMWYSIGRFFIEGLRTDSLMLTQFLKAAQVMSLLLIAGSLIVLIIRRRYNPPGYWTPLEAVAGPASRPSSSPSKGHKPKKKKRGKK
jgi:phosphatidylglycerol:prolipoprotein diacylglycerol transferase